MILQKGDVFYVVDSERQIKGVGLAISSGIGLIISVRDGSPCGNVRIGKIPQTFTPANIGGMSDDLSIPILAARAVLFYRHREEIPIVTILSPL